MSGSLGDQSLLSNSVSGKRKVGKNEAIQQIQQAKRRPKTITKSARQEGRNFHDNQHKKHRQDKGFLNNVRF
jgi:hypothetical protein